LDTVAQNASHSAFLIARAVMACLSIAEFKPKTNSPPYCSIQSIRLIGSSRDSGLKVGAPLTDIKATTSGKN